MDRRAVVPAFPFEAAVAEHFFRLRKDGVLQAVLAMSHRLVHVSGS